MLMFATITSVAGNINNDPLSDGSVLDRGTDVELWSKTFGGTSTDYGYSIIKSEDGNYIIIGLTLSYGNGGQISFIKTDTDGNELINNNLGGSGHEGGYSVIQVDDGYIISGFLYNSGTDYDALLMKTDLNGNEVWSNTFGGSGMDESRSVFEVDDGYIMVGYTRSYGAGYNDGWLIKTDQNGNEIYNKTYGTSENDILRSAIQIDDGIIMVGNTNSYASNIYSDAWLIKTDHDGNEIFNETYGGSNTDRAIDVKETDDGYIIVGITNSFGNYDALLIKTDHNGNELWNNTIGGSNREDISSVLITQNGYIIFGSTRSFGAGENDDFWLVHTDLNGDMIEYSTFGGSEPDSGCSIIQDEESFVMTGSTMSYGAGGSDIWLVKTIPNYPPETPDQPTGPEQGEMLTELCFSTSSTIDPEDDDVSYLFNWDDGTNSGWIDIPESCHTWSIGGEYEVKIKAKDNYNHQSDWSVPLIVEIINHPPETPSRPEGATEGMATYLYSFKSSTTDVDQGDQLFYRFDWGEGEYQSWQGPYESGEVYTYTHRWYVEGSYAVRVQAKDLSGDLSPWSPIVIINITERIIPLHTTPNKPDGEINGEVNVEYEYASSGSTGYYRFDWGDGTNTSWIGVFSYSEDEVTASKSWSEEGIYPVRVQAKSRFYSDWSTSLNVTITDPLPDLDIIVNLTIIEGNTFTVTVKNFTENIVLGANVTFNENTGQTNNNGQVNFIAPDVNKNTKYTITATHQDYAKAASYITVVNEQEKIGHIYGVVFDDSGPLNGVSVCVKLTESSYQCTSPTDENGQYVLTAPIGTYSLEVSKAGYVPITEIITILENIAIGMDGYTLKKSGEEPTPNEIQEDIINAIEEGYLGGEVTIQQAENEIVFEQKTYGEGIRIAPSSDDNEISFIVENEISPDGKTFVFYIDTRILSSSDDIKIKYDGKPIKMADNLADVLNPNDDSLIPEYFFPDEQGSSEKLTVFVSAPEFSEHTITIIYEAVEVIGGITAVILYILIGTIAGFVFFGRHVFTHPVYMNYFRKRKGR